MSSKVSNKTHRQAFFVRFDDIKRQHAVLVLAGTTTHNQFSQKMGSGATRFKRWITVFVAIGFSEHQRRVSSCKFFIDCGVNCLPGCEVVKSRDLSEASTRKQILEAIIPRIQCSEKLLCK